MKIVSGGQSGVDRAALDAAIEAGIAYEGWCPKGGWAEDMPEPPGVLARYPHLRETPEVSPGQRTTWNVRDSGAVMVLVGRGGLAVSNGTSLALRSAEQFKKPHIVLDLDAPDALAQVANFLAERAGGSLCIAGPRESEAPGIYAKARAFLSELFAISPKSSPATSPR
jgi:hypothetical protein